MNQQSMFYDDWKDAVRTLIQNSGKKPKEVAMHLWPSMKMDSAYARLKECLKDDGDSKLDFGDVLAIMRFCQQFDALYHACDELDHDRPASRAPEDEIAALQRQFIAAAADVKKLAERIERVQIRAAS